MVTAGLSKSCLQKLELAYDQYYHPWTKEKGNYSYAMLDALYISFILIFTATISDCHYYLHFMDFIDLGPRKISNLPTVT
jgi:hypothetical protein